MYMRVSRKKKIWEKTIFCIFKVPEERSRIRSLIRTKMSRIPNTAKKKPLLWIRKLVNLLVDVEEWGQVTLVNMLTRYARTQFQVSNKETLQIFKDLISLVTRQVKNQKNQYCGSGIFFPESRFFSHSRTWISDLGSNKQQSKQKVAINFLKLAKRD